MPTPLANDDTQQQQKLKTSVPAMLPSTFLAHSLHQDHALDVIARAVAAEDAEGEARAAVDRLALLAAAAALRQSAPEVAALFARTRLEQAHGAIYGTSRIAADEARRLIERALPSA